MSDAEPVVVEPVVEPVVVEPELNEIEIKATEMGWNPEGVEGKKNLSADEFIDRQELYNEIHSLKRSVKTQKKQYEDLSEHYNKVAEHEREKAIKELKSQKKVALENDDYDAVVEIDDKILDAKTSEQNSKQTQNVDNDIFDKWVTTNTWYDKNDEMKEMADDLGALYYNQNPNQSLDDIYKKVTERVQKMYPKEFSNPNRDKPNAVEGAQNSSKRSTKKRYTANDLNDVQRKVMNRFVKSGVLTEEQYVEDLAKTGQLG